MKLMPDCSSGAEPSERTHTYTLPLLLLSAASALCLFIQAHRLGLVLLLKLALKPLEMKEEDSEIGFYQQKMGVGA